MVESTQNPSNSLRFPFIQNGATSLASQAKGAFEQKSVSELPPVPLLDTRNASRSLPSPAAGPVSHCADVQEHKAGAKKPVGGVQFHEKSQISAQAMLCMIKENKKLTPWMKDFFAAQGDSFGLNPERAKKVKNGMFRITMKAGEPKVNEIPQWFLNALEAVGSGKWQFTTGVSLTSVKSSDKMIPDGIVMPPLEDSGGKYIGFGFTLRGKEIHLLTSNHSYATPNIICIANRFKYTLDRGNEVKNTEGQMVETFFHELAAHAALSQANLDSRHTSDDYRLGLEPVSQADHISREIALFFEHIDKIGRIQGEELLSMRQVHYANVSGLFYTVGMIHDIYNMSQSSAEDLMKLFEEMQAIDEIDKKTRTSTL